MGVENGVLSDLQIVVSSVLDDRHDYYGKQNIRLNTQPDSYLSAGVWVAKPNQDQFVRFDFTEPSLLSGVVTQGNPGSPEWVESFTVGYSPDGENWSTIKEPDGTDKVFIANFDSNTPVENKFNRLLNTRFLELRPKQWDSNIALRVEVLGCFHPYRKSKVLHILYVLPSI
ncbi:Hemocytin [Portunus trituberculatus]|uniref:Hemocytin n=1 Tax=Portunus trituberculatus TaxID=210409 RepID=A0A5B7GI80_PORTR|nr:Hemocytin [Portunus trituberculatus]